MTIYNGNNHGLSNIKELKDLYKTKLTHYKQSHNNWAAEQLASKEVYNYLKKEKN